MPYVRLLGKIALAFIGGLGLLIATSNDSLRSFDPYRPGTLLPIVVNQLRTLGVQVGELRVGERIDNMLTALRQRIRQASEPPSS